MFGYGGGIDVGDDATAVITGNTIAGNRAADSGGGISVGVARTGSPVDVTHNTLVANEAGDGAANASSYGGGISVGDGGLAAFRNNLFVQNVARFAGFGIHFFATGLQGITYTRNDFDGNLPGACGGLPSSKCDGGQLFLPALFQDSGAANYRLRFESRDLLAWDDSVNASVTFELYRDDLVSVGAGPIGECRFGSLPTLTATDPDAPASGSAFPRSRAHRRRPAGLLAAQWVPWI